MSPQVLITTYLQMESRREFRPTYSSDPCLLVMAVGIPHVAFYRFLYSTVGADWAWRDRLAWSDEQLLAHLSQLSTRVYALYVSGSPAGYIELDAQPDGVEIAYFGLMPLFLGQGFGKHLLSYGIQRAWELQPKRIWLHTCNLDSPHALPIYQACGFRVYRVEEEPMPAKYLS